MILKKGNLYRPYFIEIVKKKSGGRSYANPIVDVIARRMKESSGVGNDRCAELVRLRLSNLLNGRDYFIAEEICQTEGERLLRRREDLSKQKRFQ